MDELERIRKSQLVTESDLQAAVARVQRDGGEITERRVLLDLSARGLISRWQAQVIGKHGKFRGFVQHPYVFVKWYAIAGDDKAVIAFNKETREYALVRVTPKSNGINIEFLIPLSKDASGDYPIVPNDAKLGN